MPRRSPPADEPAAATTAKPTVAFDALGAERGADAVTAGVGAVAAEGVRVRVFGRAAELGGLAGAEGVELLDADELIGNDDEPVRAVRSRPAASIVRAAADVAEGRSDALASPGATGATMTAAVFALRRLRGVQRPALAVQLPAPGRERPLLLLDCGANADARPSHLVQFAYLGAAFATAVLAVERPRVALLSVGEEASKGSALVVEAGAALGAARGLELVGNVEGRELLGDAADVIVTDGFTGNVALKTIEGTARSIGDAIGSAARSGPRAALGGLLLRPALGGLRRTMEPDETGGAILLGLRGVAIVGHGSSGPDGVANAIRLAARSVEQRAVERTAELLERSAVGRAALRESGETTAGGDES